jgi:glutathione peroxidase
MKTLRCIPILAAMTASPLAAIGQDAAPPAPPTRAEEAPVDTRADDPTDVLGFTMTDIGGEPRALEEHRGKVVLIVNVASECGLTPQYEDLQALYEKYKDQGLVVLGFPANDFRGQEPGTDTEILDFCTKNYHVTFPMFSKISVVGDTRHPLYAKLAAATADQGGEPTWNFTKYLVDRSGHVVKRVEPKTKPSDPEVIAEIERLLEAPAPAQPAEKKPG